MLPIETVLSNTETKPLKLCFNKSIIHGNPFLLKKKQSIITEFEIFSSMAVGSQQQ